MPRNLAPEEPDVVRLVCTDEALGARTPLTPTERDVGWRMAVGVRDRQIARAMQTALRTVNTHARNVLAKCEVRSRAALAARVARHFAEAAERSRR